MARLGPGALRKIPGPGMKQKMPFLGARGTFGGEFRPPQKFLPEIAHLFYISRFGRPEAGNRKILAKKIVPHSSRCTYRGLVGTKNARFFFGAFILCALKSNFCQRLGVPIIA